MRFVNVERHGGYVLRHCLPLIFILLLTTMGHAQKRVMFMEDMSVRNCLRDGATCSQTTLNDCLTAIGSTDTVMLLPPVDRAGTACTWSMSTSKTIPANVTLWVPHGTQVDGNGNTLTIDGYLIAEAQGWFFDGVLATANTLPLGDPGTFTKLGMLPHRHSGCIHGTSGSTTSPSIACEAWVGNGVFVSQAANTITYSGGNGTYWLAVHQDTLSTVAGWTRESGTHYIWQLNASQPAEPSGGVIVARVILSAGTISEVVGPLAIGPYKMSALFGGIYADEHGAVGDGVANDAPAIQKACDAVTASSADQPTLIFTPGKTYKMDAEVDCDLPDDSVVEAQGVTFTSAINGVLFDINPTGNCSTGAAANCTDNVFRIWWHGGRFVNTNGTKTASIAIKAHAMRGFRLSHAHFDGWWTAIELEGKDNIFIDHINIVGTNIYGIREHDVDPSITTTGTYFFTNNRISSDGTSGLGGITLTGTKHLRVNILDTDFSAGGTAGLKLIHIEDNGTGGTTPSGDIRICGNNFEQGVSGQTFIHLDAPLSQGFKGVTICDNRFSSGSTGWTGIDLEFPDGAAIYGNSWTIPSSGTTTTEIKISGSACNSVGIFGNAHDFSTPALALDVSGISGTCVRGDIIFSNTPAYERDGDPLDGAITGYNADAYSTTTATIDMSANWAEYANLLVSPPRGYFITGWCRDSASSTATAGQAEIWIARESSIQNNGIGCQTAGLPNDTRAYFSGYVPADANGDFYIDIAATGTLTMDVMIRVNGVAL